MAYNSPRDGVCDRCVHSDVMPAKYRLSRHIDTEHGHRITSTSEIMYSEHVDALTGKTVYKIKISSWFSYMRASISLTARPGYRDHDKQYHVRDKVYRTMFENRRSGLSPATILCNHAADTEGNPDSLTTEFMMKMIEDFKREPIK